MIKEFSDEVNLRYTNEESIQQERGDETVQCRVNIHMKLSKNKMQNAKIHNKLGI